MSTSSLWRASKPTEGGGSGSRVTDGRRDPPRKTAQSGAVTLIQRFGSAPDLNIQFHLAAGPQLGREVLTLQTVPAGDESFTPGSDQSAGLRAARRGGGGRGAAMRAMSNGDYFRQPRPR